MPLFGAPDVEKMKARGDIKGLFKLLVPDKGNLSQQAGRALVEIGVPAVRPILDFAKNSSPTAPGHFLGMEFHVSEKDQATMAAATAVFKAIGEPAVETLLAAFNSSDHDARYLAAIALHTIGDPRVGESFMATISDTSTGNFFIRCLAIEFAGDLVETWAQAPIIAALNDTSIIGLLARRTAAEAPGKIEDEQAVMPLIIATTDRDDQTRTSAAESLGQIASRLKDTPLRTKAVSALVQSLKDDRNPGVRASAALALGNIVDNHAAEPLIIALKDTHPFVRTAAVIGLRATLDERKFEPLIAALTDLDKDMRKYAAESLGVSCDSRAVEPLIARLNDPEGEARASAAMALALIKDSRTLQPLIDCLGDADAKVRCNAAFALGRLGDAQAVVPLINLLNDDNDFAVRLATAKSLTWIPATHDTEPLLAALKDDNKALMDYVIEKLQGSVSTKSSASVDAAHTAFPPASPVASILIDGERFPLVPSIDALCAAIEVEGRGILRIPSITYGDVQFALAQRMEKRYGRMSRQYQDVIPSPLVCVGCLWKFPGSYTTSLLLPAVFGDVNRVTGATPGFDQFGRSGICPQCGSNESLLVYECFLPDQISEADVYAIRQYWQECALAWWEGQECERTCCRTCRTQLTKKQGYHMGGSHLICEQCVYRVLMTEGLQKLKENPHYYGSALLRKVRRFRT